MDEKWTLGEGAQKLFSLNEEDEPDIVDLTTYGRQITVDISFAEVEADEIDGIKVEPIKGISVILQADIPLSVESEEEGTWMFSQVIFPSEGETLLELVQRIAKGLGIEPEERIWEDGEQ